MIENIIIFKPNKTNVKKMMKTTNIRMKKNKKNTKRKKKVP